MSRMENDNFILSPEETKNLLRSLKNPRNEILVKRDAFFKSIASMDIVEKEDGTVLIEIPSLSTEEIK